MTHIPHTILITGEFEEERRGKAHDLAMGAIPTEMLDKCPDYMEIGEGSDKSIGIDRIREAKEWVITKPVNKKKVIYVHNAERLTTEAQNAFLKLLEEPPEGTIIILSTYHQSTLLSTVVSRCALIPVETAQKIQTEAEESTVVQLVRSDFGSRLDWCAENTALFADESLLRQSLQGWLVVLRDVSLVAVNITTDLKLPNLDATRRVATLLSSKQWTDVTKAILGCLQEIETSSVDRRLLMEVTLLNLPLTHP